MSSGLAAAGWTIAPPIRHGDDVRSAGEGTDVVLVATPDVNVAQVAAAVAPSDDVVVVHLAGSLTLEALAPHPRRASVHPLRSIPSGDIDLRGAWFAVAGDDIACRIVADLGGHPIEVADDRRAAYHAAASIASNHLVALLGQVERVAATAGVPLAAYLDLVRGTVDNVAVLGPNDALTGPVRRGDDATIERHRSALADDERDAYDAMVVLARRLVA
jgi:predicted short-subunit dehydrogenase-like oxidoreductase (DUF2520 family)